ncbi:MAG: hypothetical protein JF593_02490 [Novosphingobium sp.]|nr:hypothetical protein [Novosphingobium sp.]
MAGGSRIIAFGPGGEAAGPDDRVSHEPDALELEPYEHAVDEAPEEEPHRLQPPILALLVAATAILVWTGFFAWANRTVLLGHASPAQWSGLISNWAGPVLLIGLGWMLAFRNSRRESRRFGEAAYVLSAESARLEQRLSHVNQELSLAREFISAQSRDLDSLGRVAVERLSQHASRLASLIHDNGAQVEALGNVSANALENMERLRGQLPVIASAAKDVTNNIANAGRTAHGQLTDMVNGFNRLNEFGQASERQVVTLRTRVDEAIDGFAAQGRQLAEIAKTRFAALAEGSAEFRAQLETHEVEALACMRSRASALAEELEQTRVQLEAQEAESLTSLRARLASVRDEGAAISRVLRDGEAGAREAWRNAVAQFDTDVRQAIATLEDVDRVAMDAARARLVELAAEAEQLDANVRERHLRFEAELEQRREGASAREAELIRTLAERLAALDAQVAQRESAGEARSTAAAERLEAQFAALDAALSDRMAAIDAGQQHSVAEVEQRLARLDSALAAREGAAAERSAAVAQRLEEQLAALDEALAQRLAATDAGHQGTIAELERRLAALDAELGRRQSTVEDRILALARRLETQLADVDDAIAQRVASADAGQQHAVTAFEARLEALDRSIAERQAAYLTQSEALGVHAEAVAERLSTLAGRMAEIAATGGEAGSSIARSLQTLGDRLAASRNALTGTESAIAALTTNAVRLLELIQASAEHSRETLPQAIGAGELRLEALEARAIALRDAVGAASGQGAALSDYVLATHESLERAMGELGELQGGIEARTADHAAALAEVRETLVTIEQDTSRLAQSAQGELRSALGELTASAEAALASIEANSAATIASLAQRLSDESGAALDRTMRVRIGEIAGQLEHAAAHAAGVGREATIQLRDQLAKVNELAGNLEHRVAHAREKAEEQIDNDFSRRVALITESLNSHAIDIAKVLDQDIGETAWTAYLRGDRGIFTRRAVRLLDSGEARAIAEAYENDRPFREHVSHYIHDFESMLRQLLSTRDGHALGVTVLSSDMGKLYVALAQAIERLRN